MICQIKNFFHPLGILWYKFLSYIEVLHVLSELSKLLELSELIELPEVFSSMKKHLFHGALRPGDPLIKLLELRFVSSSSGTIQTSQSSISSPPAFPDAVFGLGQVRVKWRVEMPLTQHPVNESLLNHDGRSPRDGVGCPDAQRARKPSSTSAPNDEVLSDCFLMVNAGHIVKCSQLTLST